MLMRTIDDISRLAAAMICAVLLPGCAGELSYKRVDDLPAGSQIDALASAFHAVVRTPRVRYLFMASYEDVWAAAKEALPPLKENGKEPVLTFDEDNGLIVLGLDHRDDTAKTMDNPNPIRIKGWREEIRVELMQQPRDTTLVIVSRIVLGVPFQRRCHKYEEPCSNPIVFEPEVSNGEMERYVLGLIRQAVAKQIVAKATNAVPPTPGPQEETVAAPPLDAPVPVNLIAPAGSRPQASPPIPIPSPDTEISPATPQPAEPAATSSVAPASTVPEGTTPSPQPDVPATATTATSPAPPPDAPPGTTAPTPQSSAPSESAIPAAPTTNASEGAAPAAPPDVSAGPSLPATANVSQ